MHNGVAYRIVAHSLTSVRTGRVMQPSHYAWFTDFPAFSHVLDSLRTTSVYLGAEGERSPVASHSVTPSLTCALCRTSSESPRTSQVLEGWCNVVPHQLDTTPGWYSQFNAFLVLWFVKKWNSETEGIGSRPLGRLRRGLVMCRFATFTLTTSRA